MVVFALINSFKASRSILLAISTLLIAEWIISSVIEVLFCMLIIISFTQVNFCTEHTISEFDWN